MIEKTKLALKKGIGSRHAPLTLYRPENRASGSTSRQPPGALRTPIATSCSITGGFKRLEDVVDQRQLMPEATSYAAIPMEKKRMASPSDPTSSVKDITTQAKETIDRVTEHAQDAAAQVQRQVSAVGGNFSKAVDKSLKDQPVTTLVMVGILGFVLGAIWKA
jgi:ElaB/YqjD/DUF883 family membrane-anchored ribosome-binding protein